ncbi:MAG: hypothetical protein JSV16_13120 [Candidatus Hydrogenedentota bacterium]|nr:MAG: hypothetical protein JSV16_13120 [Candidatus Hydrogenedentota bacterium]
MKTRDQVKLLLKLHKLESNGDGIDKTKAFQRLEKSLDPGLLRRYQKLRARKGTAVAVLKDGVCSGCKMVYPESHEMLRYRNFVHSCEYCGRLLVVTDKSA